jgi:hypothetical protein
MGRTSDARRLIHGLSESNAAVVYAALGDKDAAFASLMDGVKTRGDWNIFVKTDPDFDSLRGDRRWAELLDLMHLAGT